MQADDVQASISYMREELQYTVAQTAMALEKGLPALTVGAHRYVQELQTSLDGISPAEVLPSGCCRT